MDRETLLQYFEQNYISKRAVLPRLPLGMNPDVIWEALQKRRKAKCTMLPIHGSGGEPCWYVTTDRMIAASERVVETFMSCPPPLEPTPLAPPEENYYTSLLEGIEMSPEAAIGFILSERQPGSPEEQRIHNNRYGMAFAEMNLYHPLDDRFIQTLAEIGTTDMDKGGGQYRGTDSVRIDSMGTEPYAVPPARVIPDYMREITAFLADPGVHPMIKAGVVQAWALMVRPFPEGNERLSRLLSRIGKALLKCIPYGAITRTIYEKFREEDKWQQDMEFAEQIGLVRKVNENCFLILNSIDYRYDLMNDAQKKKATEMYNSFGNDFFTQKMVVATLAYSNKMAKAVLHTFRLLRILDCRKGGVNMYQLIVNPTENPECFEPAA